jgi:hypothetical protein
MGLVGGAVLHILDWLTFMTQRVTLFYDALRYRASWYIFVSNSPHAACMWCKKEIQMSVDAMQLEQPGPLAGAGATKWQQIVRTTALSGRKLIMAYVGAGALLLDGAISVYRSGERLLTRAEKRGTAMEVEFKRRFGNLEEQAVNEIRKLQGQAEESVQQMRESTGSINDEIEKRVELALADMGLPSRERLERLSQEIDELNQKLDEQLLRLPAEPVPDPLG